MSNATTAKPTTVVTATVLDRRRLSPSFARVTVGGEGLSRFAYQGYDQWFRLFIPPGDEGRMPLPADGQADGWYAEHQAAPEERRNWMRYATVAGVRPEVGTGDGTAAGPLRVTEMDVDVVVHGEPGDPGSGPLSTWAQTAAVGDRVALLDQGTIFRPDQVRGDVLLIGDETAVPAIAGILRRLGPRVRGHAFLEVPYAEDVQELSGPGAVKVAWLPRHGVAEVPGQRLLDAVRYHLSNGRASTAQVTGGEAQGAEAPYVYAAGEMKLTKALNQLLRQERDWPKELLTVVGYWHFQGGGELR